MAKARAYHHGDLRSTLVALAQGYQRLEERLSAVIGNTAASIRAKNIGANVQLVELDNAGHFPELEQTRKAYEIITGFVDG